MLKRMEREELPLISHAEEVCFAEPWTASMIESSMDSGLDIWLVLYEACTLAGYCVFRILAGEGELLRIGVIPAFRGRGLGKRLMDGMVETSSLMEITALSLEVRESNKIARNLYRSYGFEEETVRRRYYHNPVEDAVIMWKRHI